MIRSAITVSLVEEARGGPFVFCGDLAAACRRAAELGFDAIEVFPPSAEELARLPLKQLLADYGLKLAAVGTGAGWVKHKLTLTDPDAARRREAVEFVRAVMTLAADFGAPAIIGSMQGRAPEADRRGEWLSYLAESLGMLDDHADRHRGSLVLEPLNRYETNVLTTVADGLAVVRGLAMKHVKLLCDLFHMNIEEVDFAAALRAAGSAVGHVHFVDSNRRAAGFGHLDYRPIAEALKGIGYSGYLSAEVLPLPDSDEAAKQTITTFRKWFRG